MSSILKALKKLEDAKAARTTGTLDIGADILRNDTPRRFSLMGVTLVAGLLFISGSGITYFYLKRTVAPSSGQQPPPAERSVSAIPSGAQSPQRQQVEVRPAPPPAPTPAASLGRRATIAAPPVATQPRQRANIPATVGKTKATEVKRLAAPAVQPASSVPSAVPVIKVNGIAFQNDGSGSVAVVNGVPVANGSVVEGVRVEDIQKDRVRFSYGEERFEVPLGKSSR